MPAAMLDETSIAVLRKIFIGSNSSAGLNAQKFRAEHHQHLDLIDSLVSSGYIESRDGKYSLRLMTLPEISDSTPQVGSLLYLCEHLFSVLRQAYFNNPGATITLDEFSILTDLPRQQNMYAGLVYLSEASLISGYTTDLTASDAYVTPAEKLIRHESFGQVIEEIRSWNSKTATAQSPFVPFAIASPFFGNELAFEHLLHPAISNHALPQYKDGHLRDAVLNSITAVFDLIRQKTGLSEDGNKLIGKAFSLEKPYLILSEIESESGKSDQQGFMQIFMGLYQGVRNPKAHSLDHDLNPIKAAQYLVLASLLARRIEEAETISQRAES